MLTIQHIGIAAEQGCNLDSWLLLRATSMRAAFVLELDIVCSIKPSPRALFSSRNPASVDLQRMCCFGCCSINHVLMQRLTICCRTRQINFCSKHSMHTGALTSQVSSNPALIWILQLIQRRVIPWEETAPLAFWHHLLLCWSFLQYANWHDWMCHQCPLLWGVVWRNEWTPYCCSKALRMN